MSDVTHRKQQIFSLIRPRITAFSLEGTWAFEAPLQGTLPGSLCHWLCNLFVFADMIVGNQSAFSQIYSVVDYWAWFIYHCHSRRTQHVTEIQTNHRACSFIRVWPVRPGQPCSFFNVHNVRTAVRPTVWPVRPEWKNWPLVNFFCRVHSSSRWAQPQDTSNLYENIPL